MPDTKEEIQGIEPCYRNRYVASSLKEYMDIIHYVCELQADRKQSIWFRGQERAYYTLTPSLLRGRDNRDIRGYGMDHLRSDYRNQHFRSKCDQMPMRYPGIRIEWQEIYQHHLGKTHLIDWSESAITSLMFAVEAFIKPETDKEIEHKRSTITPTVWLLNPQRLNEHVIESFSKDRNLLETALQDMYSSYYSASKRRAITNKLWNVVQDGDSYLERIKDVDCITTGVCLVALEMERQVNMSRYLNMLFSGECNPFFYLFLRYYVDRLPVELGKIPPLAIVHPYHSERIEAQRGVFTVLPYYIHGESCLQSFVYGSCFDRRALNAQPELADCLAEIRIINPARVAQDLIHLGERHAHLYPDLEHYIKEIENPVLK